MMVGLLEAIKIKGNLFLHNYNYKEDNLILSSPRTLRDVYCCFRFKNKKLKLNPTFPS